MSDFRRKKRNTLFIRNLVQYNQTPEITETTLRMLFKGIGPIRDCYIPKDFNTGRPKSFAFVEFSTQEDADKALTSTNGRMLYGKPIDINFAYDGQKRYSDSSRDRSSPRYIRASRSRSPLPLRKRNSSLENDYKSRVEGHRSSSSTLNPPPPSYSKASSHSNPDTYAATPPVISTTSKVAEDKKYALLGEIDSLRQRLQECRAENDKLKRELDAQKFANTMFLPCGHNKQLSPTDIVVIDELFKEACQKLKSQHRKNANIVKGLKNRIYYLMENKLPDVYRCKQQQEILLGECGHSVTAECWEIRAYHKRTRKLSCGIITETSLPCGHTSEIQCNTPLNSVICEKCTGR